MGSNDIFKAFELVVMTFRVQNDNNGESIEPFIVSDKYTHFYHFLNSIVCVRSLLKLTGLTYIDFQDDKNRYG